MIMNFSTIQYTLALIFLGIISFFTGEVVTYAMLSFLIIIVINIHDTLKKILEKLDKAS